MMKKQVSRGRKFLFFLLLDYIIYRFSRQKSNKINLSPKILAFSFLFISFLFISSFNFFLLAAEDKVSVLASSPLNLGAFAQIRYTAYSSEGIDSFSLRRVRLTMNATVLNNLNFRVQLEQTKSPNLVDAYLSYHPKSWVELRAGQFKIPFSYENLKSAAELDLINRSLVVESLCPGRDIGSQGRDIGAMVFLKASFFEAFFGLFNGSGINRLDNDKSKDKAYRLIISPWRSLRVGASWYDGRWPQPINSSHLRRRQGLEAQWQSRNLLLTAELIKSFDYDHEAKGWVVLASLFLSQGRIQPIFRYESLDRDVTLGNDDEKIITYGLNWHLAPRTKFQINQELHRPKTDKKRNIFLIQFQIGF